jgi:uncharacterized protein
VTPAAGAPTRGIPAEGGEHLQPVRQLPVPGLSVALEDAVPFHDCYERPAIPRLGAEVVGRWHSQFATAWDPVQRQHSIYAPRLAAIVRLTPGDAGQEVTATARNAFAAVAAVLPADHAHLALLLIHEFQQVKLGAVMDMFDLCLPTGWWRYRVAWRDGPRPLERALQGTYAYLTITDFWRVDRHTTEGGSACRGRATPALAADMHPDQHDLRGGRPALATQSCMQAGLRAFSSILLRHST